MAYYLLGSQYEYYAPALAGFEAERPDEEGSR
jgi:hypothetical protein